MRRSASVTLTLVAALGAARAQQAGDPCDAATFNAKVCKAAVHSGGYCGQGARTKVTYSHPYPYYYDFYQNYISQGGVVSASSAVICSHGSWVTRGGFGATGSGHGGSRAGC